MTFDLSAALEALRGRMQTNPSEFFANTYKWNFLKSESIREALTEDEIKLLVEGLVYVSRAEINNSILHSLLEEPESKQEYEKVRYGPNTTTAVNMGMQGALQGLSGNAASSIFKSQLEINQMEQLKHDIEQKTRQEQAYQNTPSQYMKNFFK